jgi:alpha 1,2-mannosyltransferase
MLDLPSSQWYQNSFESGQMLVDKSRHWQGLMLATYLNSYARFW